MNSVQKLDQKVLRTYSIFAFCGAALMVGVTTRVWLGSVHHMPLVLLGVVSSAWFVGWLTHRRTVVWKRVPLSLLAVPGIAFVVQSGDINILLNLLFGFGIVMGVIYFRYGVMLRRLAGRRKRVATHRPPTVASI